MEIVGCWLGGVARDGADLCNASTAPEEGFVVRLHLKYTRQLGYWPNAEIHEVKPTGFQVPIANAHQLQEHR